MLTMALTIVTTLLRMLTVGCGMLAVGCGVLMIVMRGFPYRRNSYLSSDNQRGDEFRKVLPITWTFG